MPNNRKTKSSETKLSPLPQSRNGSQSPNETPRVRNRPASEAPWSEARVEMVERAKKLVNDPDYPPAEVMRHVANLLAQHINGLRK